MSMIKIENLTFSYPTSYDNVFENGNSASWVEIETVNQSESGNGIIVRMYDAWNKKSNPVLKPGFDAKKIFICDMHENNIV